MGSKIPDPKSPERDGSIELPATPAPPPKKHRTKDHKTVFCACGRPLHYDQDTLRAAMDNLIEQSGTHMTIRVGLEGKFYRVQRHFIALHGLRMEDLPALAEAGIVEEVGR
jgi:hypothetical protein